MTALARRAAWAILGVAGAAPALAAAPSPPPNPTPAPTVAAGPPAAGTLLYSAQARRTVRTYLRLKLLEMREADLERARTVIEHRLGADALFPAPSPTVTRYFTAGASR